MIEPPRFHSNARQDYDVRDLEALGKLAIENGIHKVPDVRRAFETLLTLAGTRHFSENYCVLHRMIMGAHLEQAAGSKEAQISDVQVSEEGCHSITDSIPRCKSEFDIQKMLVWGHSDYNLPDHASNPTKDQ